MKHQKGGLLPEIIVAILILAIITSVTKPSFLQIHWDARTSVVQAFTQAKTVAQNSGLDVFFLVSEGEVKACWNSDCSDNGESRVIVFENNPIQVEDDSIHSTGSLIQIHPTGTSSGSLNLSVGERNWVMDPSYGVIHEEIPNESN